MTLRPSRAERALPRVVACFVLAYLLFTLYGYYNDSQFGFLSRVVAYPLIVGLSGLVLSQEGMLRRRDIQLLIAYVGWIALSTLVGMQSTLVSYESALYYAMCFAWLCYPLACLFDEDTRRKALRTLLHVFVAVFALVCLVALITVLLQTPINGPAGRIIGLNRQSLNRLQIFAYANVVGPAACIALLLAVYLLLGAKRTLVRVYLAFAILVFYVTVGLTVSRVSMLATAVGLALLAMLLITKRAKLRKGALTAVAVVAALGVGIAGYAGFSLCGAAMDWLSYVTASAEEMPDTTVTHDIYGNKLEDVFEEYAQSAKTAEQRLAEMDRETLAQLARLDTETLRGHLDVWGDALKGLAQQPGVWLRGLTAFHTDQLLPLYGVLSGQLYNSFFQVLAVLGLPGLALLMAFLWLVLRASLRLVRREDVRLSDQFLPIVLVAALVIAMGESLYFVGTIGTFSPLFFLLAGYVVCVSQ